jgi:CarD family transcriptional regulator
MFSVGDKVVHPGYGPGIITAIEHRQVIGEAKRYYVIDMLIGGTTLMTPVAQSDKVGLRRALDDAGVEKLLDSLAEPPDTLVNDFRERQTDIEERLKETDIFAATKVVRDMSWFGRLHGLTKRDTQLLQRAEELVGGELALVRGLDIKEAVDQVQAVMADAMREETDE